MSKAPKAFVGSQQASYSRAPLIPPVNYSMGGDDFRCPSLKQTSSLGKQPAGHHKSGPDVAFAQEPRFRVISQTAPGPNLKQISSMGHQIVSQKRSAGASTFGTSTRAGALRLYAIYSCKK
jgi:hypothetical protein